MFKNKYLVVCEWSNKDIRYKDNFGVNIHGKLDLNKIKKAEEEIAKEIEKTKGIKPKRVLITNIIKL